MHTPFAPAAQDRLQQIARARHAVLVEGDACRPGLLAEATDAARIERSWRRCLAAGQQPESPLAFDMVPAQQLRRVTDENHALLTAATPVLERLGRAIASTPYFAILTNAQGVVVKAHGAIDRADRRASLITRIGVDLSERAVGTTAIGLALAELHPVWLHRGEHFFRDTGCYSCAGAPLIGPDGDCVGMLDLTGIDAPERPELRHLVAQAARGIENQLALARPHALVLRLNWPGRAIGGDDDGLLCLDGEGWVTGCNAAAREMVTGLGGATRVHCNELFAQAWEPLFDLAARGSDAQPQEVLLWSGLWLAVAPHLRAQAPAGAPAGLRDVELALIRKAVADARGNVMEAARTLGISRATVYRKLGPRKS